MFKQHEKQSRPTLHASLAADPATNWVQSCSVCLRLCPRYLPFVLLRHLHPTHWSWWKSEASFCAPRGPMRVIYEDRIWQTQFPSCCTQNMELFTATSPFANHQPTTVPVWAQNSSLQTRLHNYMTFTSENYWGVNLLTYLLTYLLAWNFIKPSKIYIGSDNLLRFSLHFNSSVT